MKRKSIFICLSLLFSLYCTWGNDFALVSIPTTITRNEDHILINTIDGSAHLMNKFTGEVKWTFTFGRPLISSAHGPSLKEPIFLPSTDGTIIFINPSMDGKNRPFLQQSDFTAADVVRRSPFLSDNNILFKGSKSSEIISLEEETGEILYTFKNENNSDHCDTIPTVNGHADVSSSSSLLLARTDYFVEAFNSKSGAQLFNLTYGKVSIIENDQEHRKKKDHFLYVTDEMGGLQCFDEKGEVLWEKQFTFPIADVVAAHNPNPLIRLPRTRNRMGSDLLEYGQDMENNMYIGKLSSGKPYAMSFHHHDHDHHEEKLLPMPKPNFPMLSGPLEIQEDYDPNAKKEFKTCSNLADDFECLVGYHVLQKETKQICIDHTKTTPLDFRTMSSSDQQKLLIMLIGVVSALALIIALLLYVVIRQNGNNNKAMNPLLNSSNGVNSMMTLSEPSPSLRNDAFYDQDGLLYIGSLRISKEILGYGCQGTVVFSGLLGSRKIAVKRMLRQFYSSAEKEVKLLINTDGHPNVVRYFAREESGDFVYLALERCKESLADALGRLQTKNLENQMNPQRTSKKSRTLVPKNVIQFLAELAAGVAHLHKLRILHRDLKPHNILIADEEPGGIFLGHPKISDMGLGKQLDAHQSSFGVISHQTFIPPSLTGPSNPSDSVSSNHAPGSVGWQAPEILASRGTTTDNLLLSSNTCMLQKSEEDDLNPFSYSNSKQQDHPNHSNSSNSSNNHSNCSECTSCNSNTSSQWNEDECNKGKHILARRTAAVDVFSLGCVFYTVIFPGEHPFGSRFDRERNIILNDALQMENLKTYPEAYALISGMIRSNPTERLTMKEVVDHPFFWNETRRLAFLVDVSDRIEKEERNSALSLALEKHASTIIGTSWNTVIHSSLLVELDKFRKYNGTNLRDCLRMIRNKKNHYHELPPELCQVLGTLPLGFNEYFRSRFPRLLMYCYHFVAKYLPHEKHFHLYLGAATTRFKLNSSTPLLPPTPPLLPQDESYHSVDYLDNKGWWLNEITWIENSFLTSTMTSTTSTKGLSKGKTSRYTQQFDERSRTTLCVNWSNSEGVSCKFGHKCSFAHGPVELRIPPGKQDCPWTNEAGEISNLLYYKSGQVDIASSTTSSNIPNLKTKVCRYFSSPIGCINGDSCTFFHPGVDDDFVDNRK